MPHPRTTELHVCDRSGELVPTSHAYRCSGTDEYDPCDACREAKNRYVAEQRRANGGRTGKRHNRVVNRRRRTARVRERKPELRHGTAYAYAQGCGCDECRAGHAERRQRHRNGERAGEQPKAIHAKDIRTDQLGCTFMSSSGNFGAVEHDTMTLEEYWKVRG